MGCITIDSNNGAITKGTIVTIIIVNYSFKLKNINVCGFNYIILCIGVYTWIGVYIYKSYIFVNKLKYKKRPPVGLNKNGN
jgi:hypothetical protein